MPCSSSASSPCYWIPPAPPPPPQQSVTIHYGMDSTSSLQHKPTTIMQAPFCFNFVSMSALSFSHPCQILIDLLQVRLGCPIYRSLSCCPYCMISFNLSVMGHGGYLICWKSVYVMHHIGYLTKGLWMSWKTSKNAKENFIKLYDLATALCTIWRGPNVN